jgi:hypothetical protein
MNLPQELNGAATTEPPQPLLQSLALIFKFASKTVRWSFKLQAKCESAVPLFHFAATARIH